MPRPLLKEPPSDSRQRQEEEDDEDEIRRLRPGVHDPPVHRGRPEAADPGAEDAAGTDLMNLHFGQKVFGHILS
jgi:hypothetical protein